MKKLKQKSNKDKHFKYVKFLAKGCSITDTNRQFLLVKMEHANGSLEDWNQFVANPSKISTRLMFGIIASFAAPLMQFTEDRTCLFQLYGTSSKGKTTVLKIANKWKDSHQQPDKNLKTLIREQDKKWYNFK